MKMHMHATHPLFRVLFSVLIHLFYTKLRVEKHVKYSDGNFRLIFNVLGTAEHEAEPLVAIMHLSGENSLRSAT